MTWDPDTLADMEEKLAVAAATILGNISPATLDEVREHILRDNNVQNLGEKIEDRVSRALAHDWILPRMNKTFSNSRMALAQ